MDIRRALPADLPAIAAIYGHEALEGHATFDLEPRPMDTWKELVAADGPGHQGLGTGRALYDALLTLLVTDGVHLLVAAVALPTPASLALHRACGFEEVRTMQQAGRKFDRWIDLTWLQKVLA